MDRNSTVSSKPSSLWNIELLGPLCVRRDEIVYTRFRTHKTGALLAYLAVYPERTLRREELIDIFWPHYDLESGRNCLRIALSALRRLFHPDKNQDTNSPACILADRDYVRLNPATFTTDKSDFEKCLLHATHAEDINARVEWLKKGLNTYQNNLLPGYDDDWITGERQRLADQRLLAMRRLVALLLKLQDIPTALDYAHRSIELDPLREESHRMLMQIYIGMGQNDSALRQFQQLERLLDEQMGMQPTNITRALITPPNDQIIHNEEAQPLGETDTKSAAPLIPQAVPPSRLPLPITPIFGQADTIARIVEMLQPPHTRLVTLTGLGGTGKTRLAFAVAEKIQDEFEDAVWFVSLAHVSEPHQILYEIARSMGLPVTGDAPILTQLADCLGKKPALFLLDSFDCMVGRGNAIIADLLDALPAAVCLITSRQRLNISGEYEFAVEPLPTPLTAGTPERLMEFASVQLFVNSARAVRSHFQITRENAPAIASLCHHLEGVPLAIELAAAYVQVLSPAQIRTRLTQRFNFLVNRNSNAPERHASLRATLDWSFRLLPPQLQRYFARLGTLRDGWTVEAAQAICTDLPDTLPPATKVVPRTDLRKKRIDPPTTPLSMLSPSHLRSSDPMQPIIDLRERSLIRSQEHNGEMRYFMLETVREYALEQLPEEDCHITHMRHARFFLQSIEEAEPNLAGPDAALWLNKLQTEYANIQAALRFLLPDTKPSSPLLEQEHRETNKTETNKVETTKAETNKAETNKAETNKAETNKAETNKKNKSEGEGYEGLRLAGAMGAFWFVRGYLEEGLTWLNRALQMNPEAPPSLRSKALRQLANIAYQNGDLDLAHTTYNELLHLARSMGDNVQLAAALSGLAIIARLRGDLDTALLLREQSLELFRAEGHLQGIALVTAGIGIIAKQRRNFHAARQHFEESLTLYRQHNDPHNIALALNNLADCLLAMDLLPEAYACLSECLPIVHALNNKNGVILGLLTLVSLARKQNQFVEAAKLLGSVENQILSYPGSSIHTHDEEIAHERKLIVNVLGEPEFLRARQQGLYLSFEQAMTYRFIQK